MSDNNSRKDALVLEGAGHLLGYFSAQVLASYRNEPDKYELETDFFVGRVRMTSEYYRQLEEEGKGRTSEYIDVLFGFRTLSNGDLAVVAWLPDLFERSKSHVPRWRGFYIKDPEWIEGPDERFKMWVNRYLKGSWAVESGPLARLRELVASINSLTSEVLGKPLFQEQIPKTLGYPSAQNNHRYHDAHSDLYGYLIDGIDKETIELIANYKGDDLNIASDRTINALRKALPQLPNDSLLWSAFNTISEHRRNAAHGPRPPVARIPAFEEFTEDLEIAVLGLTELLDVLENLTGVDAESARKTASARKGLPKIVRPAQPNFAISRAPYMVGKTVERVEYGFREENEHLHQSEALIIYFADGSIMAIDTGSNAYNLGMDFEELEPPDVHVDLNLTWVPPLEEVSREEEETSTDE